MPGIFCHFAQGISGKAIYKRYLLGIALSNDNLQVFIQPVLDIGNFLEVSCYDYHVQFFCFEIFRNFIQACEIPLFWRSIHFLVFSLLMFIFPIEVQFFKLIDQIHDSKAQIIALNHVNIFPKLLLHFCQPM